MDEAIRRQKELEDLCEKQKQLFLVHEERRNIDIMHDPAILEELLKLLLELRMVVQGMYEKSFVETLGGRSMRNMLNRSLRVSKSRRIIMIKRNIIKRTYDKNNDEHKKEEQN